MLPDLHDTIVALATAPAPGARAVVRLSGSAALRIASAVCRVPEPLPPGTAPINPPGTPEQPAGTIPSTIYPPG